MPQATLEQIRIARVARRAREAGDRDTYERAVSMLRRSVVGDGWAFGPAVSRESAASPGTSIAAPSSADPSSELRGQIEALRRDVSSWRWPQATIDWADAQARPQDARRRLQAVRELARDNVLEGVSRANRALRSGDLELARATYDRALARWGAILAAGGRHRATGRRGFAGLGRSCR